MVDLELLWLGNSIFVRKSLININIESLKLNLHDNLWPPGSFRLNSSIMNRIRARDGSSLIEWWNLTCRVNWFYKNNGKEQWKCHEMGRCNFPGRFVEFSFVLQWVTCDKSAWLLIAWQSARIWRNDGTIIKYDIFNY